MLASATDATITGVDDTIEPPTPSAETEHPAEGEDRGSGDPVFLVETYRSSTGLTEVQAIEVQPGQIVGVLDIPADEMALVLVAAPDAETADRVARARGLRPIRIVPAHWDGTEGRPSPDADTD